MVSTPSVSSRLGGGGEGAKSEVCNQDQKSGCLVALL